MTVILNWLYRLLCWHKLVLKTDTRSGRVYTECMRCNGTTSGIVTGPGA